MYHPSKKNLHSSFVCRDHVPALALCMGREEEEPGPRPGLPIPMLNKPHSTAGKAPSFLPQHLGGESARSPSSSSSWNWVWQTSPGRRTLPPPSHCLQTFLSRLCQQDKPPHPPGSWGLPQTKRDQKCALINLDPAQQNPHWVHSTQIPLKSNFICSLQFHVGTELEFRKTLLMCYFRGSQR